MNVVFQDVMWQVCNLRRENLDPKQHMLCIYTTTNSRMLVDILIYYMYSIPHYNVSKDFLKH